MLSIVFATNNAHKLAELRRMLGERFRVLSLADIDCHDDIPETSDSFAGNALQKARWVKEHYGYDCFADVSWIEVVALVGAPGILSAGFAGTHGDSGENNARLLTEMEGKADRHARFRCVIALLLGDDAPRFFEGTVEGSIIATPSGNGGFGYDPLFRPDGWDCTFAEASAERKNAISHRGRAVAALARYLETL